MTDQLNVYTLDKPIN